MYYYYLQQSLSPVEGRTQMHLIRRGGTFIKDTTSDDLLLLTFVIDSITEEEETSNQTDKRHSRRVVAIKVTALETSNTRRGLSLRKL